MPEIHARYLQASAAARWGRCPASVLLCKDIPNESSEYAKEGTRAHRLCELLMRRTYPKQLAPLSQEEEQELLSEIDNVDAEMRDAAFTYQRTILSYVDTELGEDTQLFVEKQLDISWITGEDGAVGTADFIAVLGDTLHVFDFKYGRGVPVNAVKNEQLGIYGAAALRMIDPPDPFGFYAIEKVVLHIVQPRLDSHSEWEQPAALFREGSVFIENAHKQAARALALLNGAAVTDRDYQLCEEACRFCRAKAVCPKQVEKINELVDEAFSVSVVDGLTGDSPVAVRAKYDSIPVPADAPSLAKAYGWLDAIEEWCEAVREEALKRLKEGKEVPGYKLVAGRAGPRKWANEREAEAALVGYLNRDEAYERKLISPTTAEKLHKNGRIKAAKWKKLQPLISRSAPKPTIAPTDDPRPDYGAAIAAEFENLDEKGNANE